MWDLGPGVRDKHLDWDCPMRLFIAERAGKLAEDNKDASRAVR